MTKVSIRRSPRGDWISRIEFPAHPGDKCVGAYTRRFPTPETAAQWLAGVVQNHLEKRARFIAEKCQAKAQARALAVRGAEIEAMARVGVRT
jgi:O-succinylbenzoate synthase